MSDNPQKTTDFQKQLEDGQQTLPVPPKESSSCRRLSIQRSITSRHVVAKPYDRPPPAGRPAQQQYPGGAPHNGFGMGALQQQLPSSSLQACGKQNAPMAVVQPSWDERFPVTSVRNVDGKLWEDWGGYRAYRKDMQVLVDTQGLPPPPTPNLLYSQTNEDGTAKSGQKRMTANELNPYLDITDEDVGKIYKRRHLNQPDANGMTGKDKAKELHPEMRKFLEAWREADDAGKPAAAREFWLYLIGRVTNNRPSQAKQGRRNLRSIASATSVAPSNNQTEMHWESAANPNPQIYGDTVTSYTSSTITKQTVFSAQTDGCPTVEALSQLELVGLVDADRQSINAIAQQALNDFDAAFYTVQVCIVSLLNTPGGANRAFALHDQIVDKLRKCQFEVAQVHEGNRSPAEPQHARSDGSMPEPPSGFTMHDGDVSK
ncbi:unnamed protein product, partial [Mesorhabditis spiculigera]